MDNPPPRPGFFPTTDWSQLGRARNDRQEMNTLLTRYLPAMCNFLVAVRRIPREQAEDIVQAFAADVILDQELLKKVQQKKGKFRSYLLRSLLNYYIRQRRKDRTFASAVRDSVDAESQILIHQTDTQQPEDIFALHWAKQTIDEAIRRMEAGCKGLGNGHTWRVFEARLLDPIMHQTEPVSYEALTEELGTGSTIKTCNLLVTAKRTFTRILHEVISDYLLDPQEAEAELADLWAILSKSGA